jgi:hypothetical protein
MSKRHKFWNWCGNNGFITVSNYNNIWTFYKVAFYHDDVLIKGFVVSVPYLQFGFYK